jgi:ketosteroid isomerase-like protein
MGRTQLDRLLPEFYAARVRGDLEAVCRSFSADASFHIASASKANAVALNASGDREFRPILALLIKTFTLADFAIQEMIVDGPRVTVRWRADVRSRITGATVPTQLIDLVEFRDGLIVNFNEICLRRADP